MVRSRIAGASAALAVALCGCGGAGDSGPASAPDTPLAAALASVGGGGENGSLGVGWAEPRLVDGAGASPNVIAAALGPTPASVIVSSALLRRRFELDPLRARRLVSVGGSYAFGLRLDGATAPRLERALYAAGGREREVGAAVGLDVGGYASVPDPLLRAGILGLGARDAFGGRSVVLAISDTARAALLGQGGRLLEQPIYAAAADCLGERIVAARLTPAKLLLSTELGFEQVAIGITADREVICALGYSAERAEELAAAMRRSLALDATEPRTDRPISDYLSAARISTEEREGIAIARAELTRAPGTEPGFVFDTIARGSLAELITGR